MLGDQTGGRTGPQKTVECLDLVSLKWTKLRSMRAKRCGAGSTVLGDGRLLVAGGKSSEHLLLRSVETRRQLAEDIQQKLTAQNITSVLVESRGQMGGGTLPDLELPSFALELQLPGESGSQRASLAEKFHRLLLKRELPLVGYLKSGLMYIDVLSLFEEDTKDIALAVIETWKKLDL